MSRPRTPIGTFGEIDFTTNAPVAGRGLECVFVITMGNCERSSPMGQTRKVAERRLKEKLAGRGTYSAGMGELCADTPFPTLVEVWLEDLDLEDRIAVSTRELYERDMRTDKREGSRSAA